MYRGVPLSSFAAVCECPWQPQASTAILQSHRVSPHPKKKRKGNNWLLQCRQSPTEQHLLGLLIQPSTYKSCSDSCPCGGWGSLTACIQLSGQHTLIPLNLHTQFSLECFRQYGWALELEVVNYTNNSLIARRAQMKWTCQCGSDLQCGKWNRRASQLCEDVHEGSPAPTSRFTTQTYNSNDT